MNNELFIFKSIWFVDDDPDDTAIFEDVLKEIQPEISVNVIHSGEALLELLRTLPLPDLLFLDLKMAALDGRQCLRLIRNNLKLTELPIIIYSSSPHPGDVITSYQLGANLYVKKQNNYGDIVGTIKQVLKMDWNKPDEIDGQCFFDSNDVPFRAQ
jgi:CheY-like chemotaxis protein